jgi:hypothetical protein
MSVRRLRTAAALAALVAALGLGSTARAQYGYPAGYGGYGWGGWGGGGSTVQGSVARGMGAYAAGAGYYNQSTAVARSINANTAMQWNNYMYQSQLENNRNERARIAARAENVNTTREEVEKRLRDNPEPRDIYNGNALNLAVEKITDPRVYTAYLPSAKTNIPGQSVQSIPFQYAPGAITISIHRLTDPKLVPKALLVPAFEADRAALREIRAAIRKQLDEGKTLDPELINKALAIVNGAEVKLAAMLPNQYAPDRVEADKYLKALHGLIGMLSTPALDVLTAGLEKRQVGVGELLNFMGAYNLRFGAATTPNQRLIYDNLFSTLRKMRDEAAPALAKADLPKTTGNEAGEFFQGMDYKDLQKRAPAPAPPKPAPPQQ